MAISLGRQVFGRVDGGGDQLRHAAGLDAGPLSRDAPGQILVQVGDGHEIDRVELVQGLQILRTDGAEPDDAYSQRLAHRSPLSMIVRTLTSPSTPISCPIVVTNTRPAPTRALKVPLVGRAASLRPASRAVPAEMT